VTRRLDQAATAAATAAEAAAAPAAAPAPAPAPAQAGGREAMPVPTTAAARVGPHVVEAAGTAAAKDSQRVEAVVIAAARGCWGDYC